MSWSDLSPEEIKCAARDWLLDLNAPSSESSIGQSIVMMGFMAPPEQQWEFVVEAVQLAKNDDMLGHIAAGPAECLLSRHGIETISLFEKRAREDRKFARMLTGIWKHLMSDEVWERVECLQSEVDEPLESDQNEQGV